MYMYLCICILLASTSWFIDLSYAAHNVTVDDNNSAILYSPGWTRSAPSPLDYGGSHVLTTNPGATATFTFTGVAIYIIDPLWPYVVNAEITLDGTSLGLLDLQDHSQPVSASQGSETAGYAVRGRIINLENTQHTLVISVGSGQQYSVVDGFIYTVLDPTDTISSSSVTRTAASTSAAARTTISSITNNAITTITSIQTADSSTPTHIPTPTAGQLSTKTIINVVVGCVVGFVALCVLTGFLAWLCCFRSRKLGSSSTISKVETWASKTAPRSGYNPSSPPAAPSSRQPYILPSVLAAHYSAPGGAAAEGYFDPYQNDMAQQQPLQQSCQHQSQHLLYPPGISSIPYEHGRPISYAISEETSNSRGSFITRNVQQSNSILPEIQSDDSPNPIQRQSQHTTSWPESQLSGPVDSRVWVGGVIDETDEHNNSQSQLQRQLSQWQQQEGTPQVQGNQLQEIGFTRAAQSLAGERESTAIKDENQKPLEQDRLS